MEAAIYGDIIQSNHFAWPPQYQFPKSQELLLQSTTFWSECTHTASIDNDNGPNLPNYEQSLQFQRRTDFAFRISKSMSAIRNLSDKIFYPKENYTPAS